MNYLLMLPFAILSGVFGRMGGSENYNSNWRDIGINLLHVIFLFFTVNWIAPVWLWLLIVYFGLFKASISTYWDFLFGFDNFWMHGFMLGLSAFVICFITGHWWLMLIRSIGLALFMGIWYLWHPTKIKLFGINWNGAQIEEFGRYAVLTATLPMVI